MTRRLLSPPVIVGAVAALMAVFDLGAVVFATNDEARFPLLARDILAFAMQDVIDRAAARYALFAITVSCSHFASSRSG